MRKLSIILLSFSLALTSCDYESLEMPVETPETRSSVSVTLKLSDNISVRSGENTNSALGGATNVGSDYYLRFILAIYDSSDDDCVFFEQSVVSPIDGSATFSTELYELVSYYAVAWADFVTDEEGTDNHYGTSSFPDIDCSNVAINDESCDAYYARTDITGTSMTMTLKRPFAKLRLVTTNWNDTNPADEITLTYGSGRFTSFDARTGVASTSGEALSFTGSIAVENPYSNGLDAEEGTRTVAVDYILINDRDTDVNLAYTVSRSGKELHSLVISQSIPLRRNYLTTVTGNLFTESDSYSFGIGIDDSFGGEMTVVSGSFTIRPSNTVEYDGNTYYSVGVGETVTLTPSLTEVDEWTWASSDEGIATVENGVVSGVSDGLVTITATYEDTAENTIYSCSGILYVILSTSISSEDSAFTSTDDGGDILFAAEGGEVVINVDCAVEWAVESNVPDNITSIVNTEDGTLTVTAEGNTEADAIMGTITLKTLTGTEFATIRVTQPTLAALILEYTINEADITVYLPLSGTVACDVDWGDGSDNQQTSSNYPSHTYSEAGVYDVSVTGTVTKFNSQTENIGSDSSPDTKLTAVKQWGLTGLTSMQNAFRNCSSLTSIPADEYGAFRNVETFYYAFTNCPALTEIPAGLFNHCTEATDFTAVFRECSSLIKIPEHLFDNCAGATTLTDAFYMCSDLKEIPDYLFANNSEVTKMRRVFYLCTGLTEIPGHLFDNCTKVEDMSYVFGNSLIKSIPEGLFDDCTGLTVLADAFYKCTELKEIPDYLFANNSEVTDMNRVFFTCTALTEIPGHLFDNCTKVEDMSYAFSGCTALESIPVGLFDDCRQVTNFQQTFYNCRNWSGESPYTMVGENKVHLYERVGYGDDFAAPETHSGCFSNCSKLTDYNLDEGGIPDEWK